MLRLIIIFLILSTSFHAQGEVKEYPESGDYVILLHGIMSSKNALTPAAKYFRKQGLHAIVVPYPSRKISIETAAEQILLPAIHQYCTDPSKRIHFVGHSMGGIVIRYYLAKHLPPNLNLGRVVLIAAPNHGSELADIFSDNSLAEGIFGPALNDLKTSADSLPNRLGPADYNLGIIMGKAARIPWLSKQLPEDDDWVVSANGGKIKGMNDFILINGMHASLKRSPEVFYQTYHFLQSGRFNDKPPTKVIRKHIRFRNLKYPAG
ncbi:MAG: hypothetical protein GXP30_04370 [Verrucomicrobia bacterium]|nr:hypothetical protein [Verrucomicrobiota bacterium]